MHRSFPSTAHLLRRACNTFATVESGFQASDHDVMCRALFSVPVTSAKFALGRICSGNRHLALRLYSPIAPKRVVGTICAMSLNSSRPEKSDSFYINADLEVKGASNGSLAGLTFAAKDMYDIKGQVTGFGNPVWYDTHEPADATAPIVQCLLDAGATLKGRTHMDELAFSLNGENFHYGTPRNPAAPDRIPGGSSSGSACAVAKGDVDFAIGSDTGGSVRVPASYTGILGIRPTHGRVCMDLSAPLGKSYDTGGWFGKDAQTLAKAGHVLLNPTSKKNIQFKRWLVGKDAFEKAFPEPRETIFKAVQARRKDFDALLGTMSEVTVADESIGQGTLTDWIAVFRVIQACEAWRDLGPWITQHKPQFGPGTKERFEGAAKLTKEQWDDALAKREVIIEHMTKLLGDDAVLIIPTAPGPAPLLDMDNKDIDIYRQRLLSLTCIAGNAQLPQINVPCGESEGAPLGLSIIGPSGSDEALLDLAAKLHPL